jgi:DnaJ-class molecular chaperone
MSVSDEPTDRRTDYYEKLGIARDATAAEITAAYRRLARSLHPDTADGRQDTRTFQDVVLAHQVLSDPVRRRTYDRQIDPPVQARSLGCPVCKGVGRIAVPCARCGGIGVNVTTGTWLRAVVQCRTCRGRTLQEHPCGACAGSGVA